VSYLDDLSEQLSSVGVAGRQRARILAEIADHLSCDPSANLGAPDALARQFADELGTTRARHAAFTSFAALALVGMLFAAALMTFPGGVLGIPGNQPTPFAGDLGAGIMILASQVAFVAGTLAALRALHRRRDGVIARSEAVVMVRRSAVALGAGVATMVGMALVAVALRSQVAPWWPTLALVSAGVGVAALAAATPAALRAGRLRPVHAGGAGDMFDDLGPVTPGWLRGKHWTCAALTAAAVAIVVTIAGAVQADGYDGALRGILDGGACLAGFALLGRYLGLRA
jgi:hypothetical protein